MYILLVSIHWRIFIHVNDLNCSTWMNFVWLTTDSVTYNKLNDGCAQLSPCKLWLSHWCWCQPALAKPIASMPKLVCPKIHQNSTKEDLNAFLRRWETFWIGSHIVDAAAPTKLLQCATEQLGKIVLRVHPTFNTKPLAEALTILKSIAVALDVLWSDLASEQFQK